MNHNEVLGVNPGANASEINRAYRKAAKEVHPDVSNSPEAAQAFDRINKARDALLAQTDTGEDIESIRRSTASATSATAAAAFTPPSPPKMSDEEIAHIQELDRQAAEKTKFSFFRRNKESDEVKRHRRSIKTNEQRINGKY